MVFFKKYIEDILYRHAVNFADSDFPATIAAGVESPAKAR
jgi:hypothetical protein